MTYESGKISYTIESLQETHSKQQFQHDELHMLRTLEKWKNKWSDPKKQKMVFLCVSGGGQRAALWTVNSLLKADSMLEGTLLDQSFLITGASGGAIGAAYYRELDRQGLINEKKGGDARQHGKGQPEPCHF